MRAAELRRLDRELHAYIESFVDGMGRPERRRAMGWYITGLLLDGERKSIEPMAARLVDDEHEIAAMRQRLHGCIAESAWSDDEVRARLARKLDREMPDIEALVVDDTGFPKKGEFSVGVQRQYCGTLGRRDNCQVATSLHLAGEAGSACIALRLYLPESWTDNQRRRRSVGVPDDVPFLRKWEIALQQLDDALQWGVRRHTVLADAGYGDAGEFRAGLEERGLQYVVGVNGTHLVWPPGSRPRPPTRTPHRPGLPPTQFVDGDKQPVAIAELVKDIPRSAYRKVAWREGSRGRQSSRFLAMRVHVAAHHYRGKPPTDEQWLLCNWLDGEDAPKFWLSNLPATTTIKSLVALAKLRWRVERDYQELKQEIGLDHFEGRTWRGFHHHATLCAVAHAFLALRRALSPPIPNEVDASDGAPTSPAGAAAHGRYLSAVSAAS
jgi:SRSO17 transposase